MNAVASFRKSSKMEDSTAFLRPTGTAKSCCSDAADGNEIKEADRTDRMILPARLMTPKTVLEKNNSRKHSGMAHDAHLRL